MFSNNNTFNENGTTNDRVEQFSKQLFGGLVQAAKLSNNLPSEEDYSYYETFPEFKLKMNSLGKRLLNLAQNFVQSENPKSDLSLTDTNDVDDLSDRFSGIVDIVDGMIDKVDKTIDPKYNQNQTNIFISSTIQPGNSKKAGNEINMFYGNNIVRPQHKFEDPFDNNNFPFLPKIRSKPNAMVELDEVFKKSIPKEISFGKIIRSKEQEGIIFPHPYEYEINNFKYTEQQTQQCKEILARGLDETPFTWVETVRQLEELVEKLIHCQEIAIDLEHHSYRTYQGFTCLMQISTRSEDFLIDTLLLRSHIHMLNQVFTNPSIVKVLHGSDSDIKWLQRDFGVYIVNMFDTGQASRILEYPSASLAFLLKFYCAIDANKKYQLADWRIRKLPEEMIKYAREDTHYLLYIYDRLRNELISKGNKNLGSSGTSTNTSTSTTTQLNNHLLLEVLRRSRELSLLRYEKDILDDNSHINFAKKLNLQYSPTQLNVLKVLYHWREGLARDEDESVRYILPNQMMLTIVERQPTSVQELLTLCSPIPPSIKQHSHQLIQEILKARIEDPSKQPSFIPQLHSLLNNQSNVFYTQKQQQIQQQQIQQQQQVTAATVPQATTIKPIIQPPPPQQQQLQQPQQQQPIKTERSLSPVPNIKNHNSNSPVLTTDQLYKTAKWLSSDVDNATGNGNFGQSATTHVAMVNNLQPAFQSLTSIGKKSTCVSSVNQSNHSSTSISTNSLFDISSSGDDENHPDRKRSKRIASMVASSFEQSTYAPVFKPTQQLKSIDQQQQQSDNNNNNNNNNNGDGDNNQDSEITGGVSGNDDNDEMDYDDDDKSSKSSKSSRRSGNTGGGGGGTGASNGDEESDDDDDDDDDDEEDDDDESTNNNNNKDDDEDDEEDEDIDDESDDEKDSKHSNDSTSTSNSTTTTTTTTTANTSSSNLNNNQVPKSMQEIYQLSNMNRRRNKEKKKLKENSSISATTSLSTSPSSLLDSTNNPPKSKKDENASVTDTFSFLKEIGWINNEQSADSFKPVSQQLQQQPASSATATTTTTSTLSQPQQPSPQLNTSTQSNKSQIQSIPQQIQQQTQSLASSSSSSTTITTTTSGVVSKKQSKQTLQQQPSQQQPIQPSQQPQQPQQQQQQFVSFDYSQVSTIQQTNSNNPNQQQNFFNTDFQGTKKKSSSTGSVKAKSGTFVFTKKK